LKNIIIKLIFILTFFYFPFSAIGEEENRKVCVFIISKVEDTIKIRKQFPCRSDADIIIYTENKDYSFF